MPAHRTRDASARSKSKSSSSSTRPSSPTSDPSRPLLPASRAALEVVTGAPAPPTVSIISPTPRAFTFPIDDPRFTDSPSSSPFEPAMKSIRATPPVPRPFSPTSSIGSDSSLSILSSPTAPPSSQASSHRRRRSTASDIGERRPKKGDDDYIKRPENAFILFRRKMCEERQAAIKDDDGSSGPIKKQRQADLSKTISQQWKALTPEEREEWEELARQKKKEHEQRYPDYVYRPQRNKSKKKGKRNGPDEQETDESLSFLLPVAASSRSLSRDYAPTSRGHSRRAVSAPTPPPAYQSIQLPSVWMPTAPNSSTREPRISGRSPATHADIPSPSESAPLTSYDYAPNDSLYMPPPYQPPSGGYDRNHQQQSNDAYQNMYHNGGMANGPLLHALSIPQRDGVALNTISPDSLASPSSISPDSLASPSSISPSDAYASPSSSQAGPFTPADALRLISIQAQHKGNSENPESEDVPMPYGFWPNETLWANMEGLIPEDFNLGAIPPVELGLGQFETMPPSGLPTSTSTTASSLTGAWLTRFESEDDRNFAGGVEYQTQQRREEHDNDEAARPSDGRNPYSVLAHDRTNW